MQAWLAAMANIVARIVKHDSPRVQQQTRTPGDDIIFLDLVVPQGTQPPGPHATRHLLQAQHLGRARDTRPDREPRLLPAQELLAPQLHPPGRQERHLRDAVHGHHRRHHLHRPGVPRHAPDRLRLPVNPPLPALARPRRRPILDHRLLLHVRRHARLVFPAASLHAPPGAALGAHPERRARGTQPARLGAQEVLQQTHDLRAQAQGQ